MADEIIKVGILGAGYIADWHVKALRGVPGVQITAVCDANLGRAKSFAERYGIAEALGSIDDLIQPRRCDAVHVLLPPDLHFVSASRLLDAGIHVLLEKPACTTEIECEQLAEQSRRVSRSIGVSHNFLFAPIYERLKADVESGMLGPLSEVSIVWNKELGQLRGGPFGGWMFREPANVMLEVGPHSVSHLLDLVGEPERLGVETDREIALPNGRPFFRRWLVRARRGPTACDLTFSLGGGFTEHRIHVRGSIGSATADFEAGTYALRRHSPLPDDFDRHQMTRSEGKALIRQGRRKFWRYALSKFKLSKHGNDFGTSIARSIAQFYADLNRTIDKRLSIDFATNVVAACSAIAANGIAPWEPAAQARERPTSLLALRAPVLVLGGTGFIGQALVRHLVDAGHGVRLLVRDPRNLPRSLQTLSLEVVRGDMGNIEELEPALAGITTVCHLARAHVKTWDDYVRDEIGGTRNVAVACLKMGVRRLLYTGTIDSFYTGRQITIHDDTPLDEKIHRRNLYARAKVESERLLWNSHRERKLPVAIFRPGIVIGSGGSPFHWGIGMWTGNSVCRVWGRGKNPLPLVIVEDVARALVRAIDADGVIGETFNLVGNPIINAMDYLAELEKAAGMKFDIRPTSAAKFYRQDFLKWIVKVAVRHPERRFPSYRDWKSRTQRAIFNCSKAKRVLGWVPTASREAIVEEGIVKPAREWLE